MYARVITTQARLGKSTDEQRRLIEDELLPLMQQQPGFRGYLGLADPVSGKFVGISMWDSEGDNFDFGSQRLAQEINARFQPLVTPGMGSADGLQVVINAMQPKGVIRALPVPNRGFDALPKPTADILLAVGFVALATREAMTYDKW